MLTVITPTYNREKTLPACYASLQMQTCGDFVWMIVDDGSTDGTEALVKGWLEEQKLSIRYLKKENGGKASALNLAFDHLETQYACCLDSDDTFFPNTVELALKQLKQIENEERCCGILAFRSNPDGSVMGGKPIPKEQTIFTAADMCRKYKTEVMCFYKTALLKDYRFPCFEGEKFVSPSWLDYKLGQKYYFQTSWDALCCCEYIADGLTKNKRSTIVKNPKGYTCVKRLAFASADSLKMIVKHGIMYDCGCIVGKDKDWLNNAPRKLWALALMPAGYFVYLRRFHKLCRKK